MRGWAWAWVAFLSMFGSFLAGCVDPNAPENKPLTDGDGFLVGKNVRFVRVVEGLDEPVYVTHAGDGSDRLFIVEQGGKIRVMVEGSLRSEPFLDISDRVRSGGEQGLLGLAFHPDFPVDPRFFVDYTDNDGVSVLSQFRLGSAAPATVSAQLEQVLLKVDQPYTNHNGGMLAFGPDGYLYYGLGDGGSSGDPHDHGQDPSTLLGSILRLDVDVPTGYGIPADNPFADGEGGAKEVWAYGLRNPWRFSFDRDTDDLYIGDVGQNAREEIDHWPADGGGGANFGWNAYEGTLEFGRPAEGVVVFPVAEYVRTSPHCAVTGGYVFRGPDIPALDGVYVFGDYCSGWVWGLVERDGEWTFGKLFESGRSVSSFGEDEAGNLYVVDRQGEVLRFAAA